jgi:hypothetical protein
MMAPFMNENSFETVVASLFFPPYPSFSIGKQSESVSIVLVHLFTACHWKMLGHKINIK